MSTSTSATSRIPPIGTPYSNEVREMLEKHVPPPSVPPLLYLTMAQNPKVFDVFANRPILSGRGLMWTGQVSHADRELLILRVTGRMKAAHEWGVHVRYFGAGSGLTQAQNESTKSEHLPAELWSAKQLLIAEMVDSIVDTHGIDDALWARLGAMFSHAELVEMVTTVGLYMMISINCLVLKIAEEPGAPRFHSDASDRAA